MILYYWFAIVDGFVDCAFFVLLSSRIALLSLSRLSVVFVYSFVSVCTGYRVSFKFCMIVFFTFPRFCMKSRDCSNVAERDGVICQEYGARMARVWRDPNILIPNNDTSARVLLATPASLCTRGPWAVCK